MNNFFAFKLNKIEKLEETDKFYKLSFSIDSFVDTYINTVIFIELDKETFELKINYDKKLDNYLLKIINILNLKK